MSTAVKGEQEYLAALYTRLDQLREHTQDRLDQVLHAAGLGHQGLSERDTAAAELARRLGQLHSVENGLCFGRLTMTDGRRPAIGRIGIPAEDHESDPPLIDWRAPAARPFYAATGARTEGVRIRRHLLTSGRTVTAVRDEELGAGAVAGESGGPALLEALNAPRTGRMNDIVATIQAEQDAVIRSPRAGVLVVQGGPGTGKTAVALHRAAYLLYTHRERLAREVVLVVGPGTAFLRYIGEVLPSLGESGMLLATPAELYPGITADRPEDPRTAALKGTAAMAGVIAAALHERQWLPEDVLEIDHEGEILRLDRATAERLRRRVREEGLPHNEAAPLHRALVIDALAHGIADRLGAGVLAPDLPGTDLPRTAAPAAHAEAADDPYGDTPQEDAPLISEDELEDIRAELRDDPRVRAALRRLWPPLTPQRLLTDLFASPDRLAAAAPQLTAGERELLLRAPGGGWSPSDVALLDEAAELLGTDDRAERETAAAEHTERLRLAQEALDVAYGSRETEHDDGSDPESLHAFDVLDAETLADRYAEEDHRTPAERAAADRTWAFGHIVVDEAQELSAMTWRLLLRRCPARSMTLVGDIAQTSAPGGARSWAHTLDPHLGGRWRITELTVNYRLPAEIAAPAAEVLHAIDPALRAPRAVRSTGVPPWHRTVPAAAVATEAARAVAGERAAHPAGTAAVIAPPAWLPALTAAVGALPRVSVVDPRTAKGLEYDIVIVVDPHSMAPADRYVALTRATQRLGLLSPSRAD
ncbi:HelD family protein [Streptomyces sp. XC 2026]|uniref:HelD family protein n=1 Tax=Streptomyces sp. XC 2026 TaxID=2782004 RepID=UPI0019369BE0|nr:AAA family ATPase [Streptomyces sp. XC 2026]QQN77332.1 ATP-binding domain-containing protein [Streptomyces sp. XC 2026]